MKQATKKQRYNSILFGLFIAIAGIFGAYNPVFAFDGLQLEATITEAGVMTVPHRYIPCTTGNAHQVMYLYTDENTSPVFPASGLAQYWGNIACGVDEDGNNISGYAGFSSFNFNLESGFSPFTGVKIPPVTFGLYYFTDQTCNWSDFEGCTPSVAVAGNIKATRDGQGVWTISNGETCYDGIKNQNEILPDIGGVCGFDYLTNSSQIDFISPIVGETYNDNNITFAGHFAQQSGGYNNILVYLVNANTEEGETFLIPISTEYNLAGVFQQNKILDDGEYFFTARLYNSVNYTFGNWFPAENTEVMSFIVGADIIAPPAFVPEDCAELNIFCHIRNAFGWAFTLDTNQFQRFIDLKEQVAKKPPFGYIQSIFDLIDGINTNSPPKFVLEQVVPITNIVFNPIRTGLTWFIYITFAFYLFRRFKDIQI